MQFALSSANKALSIAHKIKDSVLIADSYAFKGYIYEGLDSLEVSNRETYKAYTFYPKLKTNYELSLVTYPQIVNQLAQVFVVLQQPDSAFFYNTKAYGLALQQQAKRSQRAINLCLITFGNIHLLKNNKDSALYYYQLCKEECKKNDNYDIVSWALSKEIVIEKNNPAKAFQMLETSMRLMEEKEVSPFYQKIFFDVVFPVFETQNNQQAISLIQTKRIKLFTSTNTEGNKLVQEISQQYVASENALLRSNVKAIESKRLVNLSFIVAGLLAFATMFSVFYFRQRIKQKNLQQIITQQYALQEERNRIARDMHDDLGSGLTRINYIAQKATLQPTTADVQHIKSIATTMVESMREMQLHDNGKGFVISPTEQGNKHYGIQNIEKRMENLSGTVKWKIENGVMVSLVFPYNLR
jgi:tetratricopeptide (TPR) repeat protein